MSKFKGMISMGFLAIIFCFAWWVQDQLILNSDVSWLIHATGKLLKGGSYQRDFFETNPPLILYLYIPILYFKKIFLVDTFTAVRIYVCLLASISLGFCFSILQRLCRERSLAYWLTVMLAILFLFLPMNELAQRENLLVILTMPYFLLVALRLEKLEKISTWQTVWIGIMAGLGFAIKPYFYFPFAFVELYYLYQKRNVFAWLRVETTLILTVMFAYVLFIYFFHRDYLNFILPLIIPTYYQKYNTGIRSIVLSDQAIFAYFIFGLYLIRYQLNPYRQFSNVLMLSIFGFWLTFMVQRVDWYYHAIPLFSVTILLATLLFGLLIKAKQPTPAESISLSAYSGCALLYFCTTMSYIYTLLPYYTAAFLALFSGIVISVLYSAYSSYQDKSKIRLSLICILYINCIFWYLHIIAYKTYQLEFAAIIITLLFLFALPQRFFREKLYYLTCLLLGIVIFLYPFYKLTNVYSFSAYYKKLYQHFINTMQTYQRQTVYYFSSASELEFPVIDYTQQQYVSRFWSMVWLPSIKNPDAVEEYAQFYSQNKKEMDFYADIVTTDLINKKPYYIFVDMRKRGHYFYSVPPDYIKLFSNYPLFANEWKQYHYINTIDYPPLYKFDVYVRS